jgi:hypothetical protein
MKSYKIVVYVPEADGEAVRGAMGAVGAGRIGNYADCSFTVKGIGRFRPRAGAHPTIGTVGQLTAVEEERIETVCAEDKLKAVLKAIRAAHPYEEPAIDVYPIELVE